ncbi:MAG: hypothetical protein H6901_02895 [Rhodobacteraceae bacterium]|nr:hypothetical protein [Paracoccaceae bacterium]MCP5341143.1 hypothetical protein [Paracoccaceae bacterium]
MTRRDEPEIPFTGRSWDEPPRRRPIVPPDPAVTTIDGREFRRESSIVVPDFTVTQDEQRVLGQRAQEAAARRLADKDANLAAAVRLGAALKVLKGED